MWNLFLDECAFQGLVLKLSLGLSVYYVTGS